MKKGDLVHRQRFKELKDVANMGSKRYQELWGQLASFWSETAIIVKGPYEHVRINETMEGHKYSAMMHAVDVLYKGKIHKGLPLDDFDRI